MTYERDSIRRMSGYLPGEQPRDSNAVKLNTNENPYPPPQAVMAALAEIPAEALRRYPSPSSAALRKAAATLHGVAPEQVVATNGGDELLRLAVTTFVEPGSPIGVAEPSYSLYPVLAAIHGSPVERVVLDAGWNPPEDFAERLNRAGVNLTLLVNPHAPSGVLLDAAAIDRLAGRLRGVLLVDEAYVDFVDPALGHHLAPLLARHDNLMLLRTFSKGYSLAGLRLGYGLGPPGLIEPLAAKTRDSYSVDAVAERLGTVALEHRADAATTWAAVRSERQRLRAAFADLGLESPASQSNFLLVRLPPGGPSAPAVQQHLRQAGLLVRHFDQDRLRDRLRISVGTPEQNDAVLGALQSALAAPRSG